MFVNPLRNAITLNDGSQGGLYVGVVLAVEYSKVARIWTSTTWLWMGLSETRTWK